MGILAIVGMVICFGAVALGVILLRGNMIYILDAPSVALVILPTIGALMTTVPIAMIAKIPAHFKVILRKEEGPEVQIEKIVDLANKVRSGGILALEEEQIPEATMAYGVRMIVDGIQEEEIKNALDESLESLNQRHGEAVMMYEKAANYAPAFGMCATVVALVLMLMGLDFDDPEAIGKLGGNMSAALITTLYGAMAANILFIPLAARLKLLHKREVFSKNLICTGLMAIQHGNSPTFIQELLCEQLNAEKRKLVNTGRSKGGGD